MSEVVHCYSILTFALLKQQSRADAIGSVCASTALQLSFKPHTPHRVKRQ